MTRNEEHAELARQLQAGEITTAEFSAKARELRIAHYRDTIANPGDLPADVVTHIRDVLLPAELAK